MSISIDFETRSRIDLRKTGVYPYAAHASTDVWCMAWATPDEEPQLWVPGMPLPELLLDHIAVGGELRAWNAQFERVIWGAIMAPRYGFPLPALEQWYDTAADAAAMSLPRGLGDAANALGMDVGKDAAGHRLMLQMARPRSISLNGAITWWDDADRRQRLYEYCRQDVRVEREIARRLRPLSPAERQVYLLDQRVNDRGVQLDLELISGAQDLVARAASYADREVRELTGGAVQSTRKVADLTRWLQAQGVDLENVRKDTLRDLLSGDVVGVEREVIELRAESAKSSTAKLAAMQHAADAAGRARGLLLYHGAGTGRWSGKLIQPQNLPRPTVKGVERFIPAVLRGDYDAIAVEEPVLGVVSSMLRSMITASPGHRLMAADFAQIEARVLAWIAEQDDLVAQFAGGGKIYEEMAAYIYQLPVEAIGKDSVERQIGKNTILGAGFGMGAATFASQVKVQTGLDLTDEDAERAIAAYRERFARIQLFWWDVNRAAMRAVREPGRRVSVGRCGGITYLSAGGALWCALPSRRLLCYMAPRIEPALMPWTDDAGNPVIKDSLTYMGVNSLTRKWQRHKAYGGLLTENVVQAMARDLMAGAMLRVERAGYPVVLTVHDELVCDVPDGHGTLDEFVELVKTVPDWADGLPVAAEGWEGARYRK
jgi:DNA polymerase bacteriophage-type